MFEIDDIKKISVRAEKLAKAYLEFNLKIKFKYYYNGIIDLINTDLDLHIEVKSCFYYKHRSKNNLNIIKGVFKLKRSEYNTVNYYVFVQINNRYSNINQIKSISIFIIDFNELRKFLIKNNKFDKEVCYISVLQLRKIKKIKSIKQLIKKES